MRRNRRNKRRQSGNNSNFGFETLEKRQLLAADFAVGQELMVDADSYSMDQIIVQFRDDVVMNQASFTAAEMEMPVGVGLGHSLGADGLYQITLDAGVTPEAAMAAFADNPMVEYASPDFTVSINLTPDDARFGEQWGLNNSGQNGGTFDADIDAVEAWDIATDASDVVVAIIDSGIDYNHPDLVNNMWVNAGEIAGDGVDNDGNGFIDDIHGWDFFNDDNDPMDDNFHGTHVAGIVGAEGDNGIGVAGVAWDVQLMGLKFLGANGSGSTVGALRSINYANQMGADIANNSWGGGGFNQAMQDAINDFTDNGGIFTAAAGNHGRNNDLSNYFPANYDNVVSVANTTRDDVLRFDSGFGTGTVEIAAPGTSILSTFPTARGSYAAISGTSMATPMVSGALAVLKQTFPNESNAELLDRLYRNTDDVLRDVTTHGRMNLQAALADGGGAENQAPNAVDDFFATDAEELLNLDFAELLANDSDPENDDIAVVSVGDSNNGTAEIVNGQVQFTPDAGFTGEGSFSYTISDGELTDTATVNVTVNAVSQDDHGNDIGSATLINIDADGFGADTGVLEENGDNDFFRFVLTESGTTEINLARADGSSVDTFLHLLDENGDEITFNDDGGEGLNSRLTQDLEAGTYYLRARAWANRSTGAYDVNIQHTTSDDHVNTPGDGATLLNFNGNNATATAVYEEAGDRDVFQLDVVTQSQVTLDLTSPDGSVDTFLRVFDADGNQIAVNDDGGNGLNSRLELDLSGGTYFVSLGSYLDRGVGNVQLDVTRVANNDDHGNIFADATFVDLTAGNTSLNGSLEERGDRDMFRFDLSQTQTLTFDLFRSGNSQLDTILRLYDVDGNTIEIDDDGGDGFNSRMTRTLSSGTYFLSVGSWSDASNGDYQLDFNFA